jgi:hypothetical protein
MAQREAAILKEKEKAQKEEALATAAQEILTSKSFRRSP